jgi:YD repeat-containing protein
MHLGETAGAQAPCAEHLRAGASLPSHDPNGNLTERTDNLAGMTETFHNDFLNRLDTWSLTNAHSAVTTTTFGYDDLGNLSTRTVAPAGGASPRATY